MNAVSPASHMVGNRHVLRTAIVVAILAAVFTGVFHHVWPLVVAGAYVIGARGTRDKRAIYQDTPKPFVPPAPAPVVAPPVVPPPPATPPVMPGLSPSAQVAARLDALVARITNLVSNDILLLVRGIVASINAIMPMLDRDRHTLGDADAFTIRQTALHYLPDTIAAYFKLPPSFRTTQPLEDGKTARVLLIEQLTVLDAKMKEIANNLATNDAQALIANGKFLRERFTTEYFKSV